MPSAPSSPSGDRGAPSDPSGLAGASGAPEALPRLSPLRIRTLVGPRADDRGIEAARRGLAELDVWDAATGSLRGRVQGTADAPYAVHVQLEPVPAGAVSERLVPGSGELLGPVRSYCTCPVGTECKHAAALLHHVIALAAAQRRDESRAPSWRTALEGLLAPPEPEADPAPLALQAELAASPLPGARRTYGFQEATPQHLEQGAELHLGLRVMTLGKRGSWIKGGLTWRTFEYTVRDPAYRTDHAQALTQIFAAASVQRSFTAGGVERLWLDRIGSPLLWQALERALEAGVSLLPSGILGGIELAPEAQVRLGLASGTEGALVLAPEVVRGDEVLPQARALGAEGILELLDQAPGDPGASAGLRARISPVGRRMPPVLQRMIGADPVLIPAGEREDFWREAYPRLRENPGVTSSDPSIELPSVRPATLHAEARYAPEDRLSLRWSWHYHDPDRIVPIDRTGGMQRRDGAHEDEVLAAARVLWPTAGGTEPEHLSGPDTAIFTVRALDALQELPDVEVQIHGTRHAYRELDGAPHVRVHQHESPRGTDWFDLGFEITIDERRIPFPSLFTALATGRTTLLMPDGTYFSLENPAFDALRALIAEGEELHEWNPQHQSLGRYQVDLWDELVEAADEAETVPAWESGLGRLRRGAGPTEPPPVPAGLTATLRPYQAEGYAWLDLLRTHGLGGILADDMGLGKTVQSLALILRAREQDPAAPPFLVVAPSSVLPVWAAEAARFAPDLVVRRLDRTRRARGSEVAEEMRGADIVLTSYTVLRIDGEEFAREEFSGLVLDEAQFVKNRRARTHQAARRIRAPFRLAITGTPMENSLEDLWSISALVTPGLLGSAASFRTHYIAPIASGEAPERMDQLRRRIRPFLLRRTKELVASELPEKNEQVLRVPLEPAHRALYDSVLQRERKKVLGLIAEDVDRSRFIVFRSLTLLRMLALDPAIVDGEEHADVPSSKLDALFDRLEEVIGDDHRVLMFSQFTSFLHRVAQRLEERGIAYSYLDGSTRDREGAVRGFREGTAPVFLISLKAGGFGLNLTEADYVFLLDPWWNPAAEAQAVDRAHRIGQERRVMVFRLVAEDTIEEKVLALQERKAALFSSLTQEDTAFSGSLSADDIRELLGPETPTAPDR